ncbi:hypothetical protein ACV3P7_03175 [Clostridium perfringens]
MNNNEIEKTIKVYEKIGIVTRNDVASMDMYSGSKLLFEALRDDLKRRNRSDKIVLKEVGLHGHFDYSSVIFNVEKYSHKEIEEYMIKYVLNDKNK